MSPWGNQLYKLALFMEDWYRDIDILSSIYDLLKIEDKEKGRQWKIQGTKAFFKWLRENYLQYFERKQKILDYYSEYIDYLRAEYSYERFFMLDSGGYSLRSEKLIDRSDLRSLFSQSTNKVSRYILDKQLSFSPTAVITLDKPIESLSIPLSEKKRRYEFSLISAKMALQHKKELQDEGARYPLLFAAVQHYGDHVLKNDFKSYEKTLKEYIFSLIDWEEKIGIRYSGFSIGSLIPVKRKNLLRNIGQSVVEALKDRGRYECPIHGLGVSNERRKILLEEGFDFFDTNKPLRLARYKLYYDPLKKKHIKIQNVKNLSCCCKICKKHDISELMEKRRGLKEISTVLIALHNYYSYYGVS